MTAFFKTFLKYRYLLQDLTVKDLKIKYRRSVLGILWSVLNPLLMMAVITAVFSSIFNISKGVINFPIFYLTGSTIYSFFSEATSSSLQSILVAAPLIKKVYIPKYIFPLEKTLFALVNLLFSFVAVIIMFLILRHPFHWSMLLFPVSIIYIFIFSTGISLMLSALTVFFRDIYHLYSVFLTALMYITPIIYPMSVIENHSVRYIVYCNPLYYFVSHFRQLFMEGTVPGLGLNLYCIGFAVSALIIGIFVFRKMQNKFILYI